ncbi:MAG: plasmid mobilization relaxosome protein MobC, partial [Campylobacterota bacterium]|nr:plasmid mobilization relaxosome protein MobC [Campylobacterota bacterium]
MKNKEFKFRLSEELYNMLQLKASASNMNASDYLRSAINTSDIKIDDRKDIGKLICSINRIGNNINQIAHNLNKANNSNKLDDINYNNILDKLTIIE